MTIEQLKRLKESEDKVEFKKAENQYSYNSGRRSVLGYVVALANEGGGKLIFGVTENKVGLHAITGSMAWAGQEGKLEEDIYRDKQIRVQTEVLYEGTNRVLVIHIPSRPVGKTLKFEDVPLMRVGVELLPMSDEQLFKILQEQEPDFSAKICEGLGTADLDETAIKIMKESYARKQKNIGFIQLSKEQVLTDLRLLEGGRLNYAALILLGKKEVIEAKLPQCKTVWEFRNSEAQIHYDSREVIAEPLFIGIDAIWRLINQPTLNRKYPVQQGAYIFDLFDFNEEVIREAVLNAIAHRDYSITSEVVIKQYPNKIAISNPGGFPKGVTIENILTVSSTPRSRLMTEVLEKTGLVERSGQGVDKIFFITLSEGKAEPDYSRSDMYQVSLSLRTEIIDKAFHAYISAYQNSDREPKLGVEQIITLCKIRNGIFQNLKHDVVAQLEKSGLILRVSGHSTKYTLSDEYNAMVDDGSKIGKRYLVKELELMLLALQHNSLKISDLEDALKDALSRNQISYIKDKLLQDKVINMEGRVKGARYLLAEPFAHLSGDVLVQTVITELRKRYE